jgi:hypothetical protein
MKLNKFILFYWDNGSILIDSHRQIYIDVMIKRHLFSCFNMEK